MSINDFSVRGQDIDITWNEYYRIQQVLLEFCDYYDAKSCGFMTLEQFSKICYDYLTDDVRFEWPDFPRKGKTWHYDGVDQVVKGWFGGKLHNYQKNAFHQPGPIQIIHFTRGKDALVRQRIVYSYNLVSNDEQKEATENVVWRLRCDSEGRWKISMLQNTVAELKRAPLSKL